MRRRRGRRRRRRGKGSPPRGVHSLATPLPITIISDGSGGAEGRASLHFSCSLVGQTG